METILTAIHYVLIISTVALVLGEFVLLRVEATPQTVALLSRVDLAYGLFAVLVVASGLARVFWGDVPSTVWASNHAFWTKMVVFGIIGGLSVVPSLRYRGWQKRIAQGGALPDQVERRRAGRFVHAQLGLYVLMPILATVMAASAEQAGA